MAARVFTQLRVEGGRSAVGEPFYAVACYDRGGRLLDANVFRRGRSPLIDALLEAPLADWPAVARRWEDWLVRRSREPRSLGR